MKRKHKRNEFETCFLETFAQAGLSRPSKRFKQILNETKPKRNANFIETKPKLEPKETYMQNKNYTPNETRIIHANEMRNIYT